MPSVFHTKTIQEILEPVAEKISTMVILDEEASQGGTMPDLTPQVDVVAAAVTTLVTVGEQTADDSEDPILKKELPRPLKSVQKSADQLVEAAQTLKENPVSLPGRRLLIVGARGILQGISDLLITNDESEVRTMVAACRGSQTVLRDAHIVRGIPNLIEFIKGLTPSLTETSKHVDRRQKELTNATHAAELVDHCDHLRKFVPMLISSIKLVSHLEARGGARSREANDNRDFVVKSMNEHIEEIIRILQLKTDRDELAQGDFKSLIGKILGKGETTEDFLSDDFKLAQDFLSRLDPRDADEGFRALDECIRQARQLASQMEDGEEKDEILRRAEELERLINQLKRLRDQGKLDTPEARALADEIARKIAELEQKMKEAIAKQVAKDFLDPTGPAKRMTNAALADPSDPDREEKFEAKAKEFNDHARSAARTALNVARHGGVQDEETVMDIMDTIKGVEALAPQLTGASRIVLDNPGDETAVDHMNMMKNEYCKKMEKLKDLVDQVTDSVEFLKVSEKDIFQDLQKAKVALRDDEGEKANEHAILAAKRCRRVLDVAKGEAENSTDPEYVKAVTEASEELARSIKPMVNSCKDSAQDTSNTANRQKFDSQADRVNAAVTKIRQVVENHHRPPPPPTPPPAPKAPQAPTPPPEEPVEEIQIGKNMKGPALPIMLAARELQEEALKWGAGDNALIQIARRMAARMAEIGSLFDSQGDVESRKRLINLAKELALDTKELIKLAKAVAAACTDRRLKATLLQLVDRLPMISTQLKIIATVKATQTGQTDEQSDHEASETLVLNAQNLMKEVKEVIMAAQSSSMKLKKGTTADELMWTRAD
eukprot:scpid35434/ scgid3194/ Vinculin; Metavinculin